MTRWVTTTAPAAQVTQVDGEPKTDQHGSEITYWETAYGKRFARITETSGFTFWMRQIDTP